MCAQYKVDTNAQVKVDASKNSDITWCAHLQMSKGTKLYYIQKREKKNEDVHCKVASPFVDIRH